METAALSMPLRHMNVRTESNVSIMKKTIDQTETNCQDVVKMLEQSVQSHIGSRVDIKG